MPARLTALLLAVGLALGIAPAANAAGGAPNPVNAAQNRLLIVQQGSSMAEVLSAYSVPLGFHSSAGQALHAAEQTPAMQALHRRIHPLQYFTYVVRSQHPDWYVIFQHHGRIVASANVSRDGKVTGVWTGAQATAAFSHGGWSWSLTSWLVLVPGSLLFLVPFFDPRRLWRMAHLDALALLAFLISWIALADAHLEPAVWLAYPPLIYLLIRLAMIGFGRSGSGRLAPLLSLRTLLIGLPLLLGARIALSLVAHQEIDVSYESVIGAYRALHHLPLYYNDPNHGDTYGPLTYIAYVPFQLIWPWVNSLSPLTAADAAAICWDLGTVAGLILLGRRLRPGSDGTRLGLVLAWAWAACPFSTIGLVVHTNDGLVAMLTVFGLVAIRSPVFSGGLLGLATAAKFSPAGLVPLIAAPRERGLKGAIVCVATFAAIVLSATFIWLPPGGLSYFWQRTIGYQIHRFDVFSPWALHASLRPIQTALEVAAVLFALAVAVYPRKRSLVQVCALAGAVTIAVQLPATHWFYYYIMWFLPFAVVGFLMAPVTARQPAEEPVEVGRLGEERAHREPALAGV